MSTANNFLERKLSAQWLLLRGGRGSSPLADRAMNLIDPERTSSVVGVLQLLERDINTARSDRDFSKEGIEKKARAVASSRLNNVATIAHQVVEMEREYLAGETEALKLPEATAVDAIVDIELAKQFKAGGSDAVTARLTGSPRLRTAIARLPQELSGLNDEQHAKIRHSLVPPSTAAKLDTESQAIGAARRIVQDAINHVVQLANPEHRELVSLFGDHWKYRGESSADERKARIVQQLAAGNE